MKKILKRKEKTLKYLSKLPKIYLVGYWYRYGIMEFAFTGKYDKKGVPLVYQYDDHNGITDQYELRPITYTTTGIILFWTENKNFADYLLLVLERYEDMLNKEKDLEILDILKKNIVCKDGTTTTFDTRVLHLIQEMKELRSG